MQQLILKSFQSPGDAVMLTAAVRDLHRAFPRRFVTDVRTSAPAIWENNPLIAPLDDRAQDVRQIDMHYPLIHESNRRPFHFIHGYTQYLEKQLGLTIPVTDFRGDIHLSDVERIPPEVMGGVNLPKRFWIIVAGGKYDFTAKWWNPAAYQQVVDHFADQIAFVQCGEAGHWHPPLTGVTNLVGKTSLRDLVWLMHHADGVLCPVTLAMHLAAAVDMHSSTKRKRRPCVVVAGGREPTHWEAYPDHQYLSTVGMLSCCADGGCWKSRCQLVGDGDAKDRSNRCEQPVEVRSDLVIPRCMHLITADDVIRRISMYLEGDFEELNKSMSRETPTASEPLVHLPKGPGEQRHSPSRTVLHVSGKLREFIPTAIIASHLAHYERECRLQVTGHPAASEWDKLFGLDCGISNEGGDAKHVYLNGHTTIGTARSKWPDTLATRWISQSLRLSPIDDLCSVALDVPSDEVQKSCEKLRSQLLIGEHKHASFAAVIEQGDQESQHEWAAQTKDHLAEHGVVLLRVVVPVDDAQSAMAQISVYGDLSNRKCVEILSITELLAILRQAEFAITKDSSLAELPLAVGTRTICLWDTARPESTLEPHPLAMHLSGNSASTEFATSVVERYRVRTMQDPVNEIALAVEELMKSPETSPVRREREADVEPGDGGQPLSASIESCRHEPGANDPPIAVPEGKLSKPQVSVEFYHGLGDAANFARLIQLYSQRGHCIGVKCTPDKEILFRAAGAEITDVVDAVHPWGYPPHDVHAGHGQEHAGSKAGWNISQSPLPDIGPKDVLWPEYCRTRVRVGSLIPESEREFVGCWTKNLAHPLVLLHTKGNTGQAVKSLPDRVTAQFYRELLDRFDGTIILFDWDNRVPRLATHRVRHLNDMARGCSTERMFALMEAADLMVGVDSGPLHAASLTDIPKVGVWMPGHYPARYSLPNPQQLNLVLEGRTYQWNRYRRVPWNIVSQPGMEWDAAWIADQCVRMLGKRKYLSASQAGADVQLQHWVGELCRGDRSQLTSIYTDRNRSFDRLLTESTRRFESPTFVETGTIRSEEDWAGAGYSTYLFGLYLHHRGGELHSVDLSTSNCQFARTWTHVYGETVHVHCSDSVTFLQRFGRPIDVLYLDSLDTTEPGHADHAMRELEAAKQWLHSQSLVLLDDTQWSEGAFTGKGAVVVPWLLNNGWQLLYAGYQVLLTRDLK